LEYDDRINIIPKKEIDEIDQIFREIKGNPELTNTVFLNAVRKGKMYILSINYQIY
jgi:hypothetical protein